MEYGVLVNNKFDMFLDDCDDPIELLQRNEEEAAKQKKLDKANAAVKSASGKNAAGKTGTKGTSSAGTTTAKTTKAGGIKSNVQSTAPSNAESKGKSVNQELSNKENIDRPPRFSAKQNENVNRTRTSGETEDSNRPRRDNTSRINEFRERIGAGESRGEDGFRGRGGFRRGSRGGRGGFGVANNDGGFDRFGKREFDRHSGSDRGGMKAMDKREGGGAHNWGNIKDDIEAQKNMESTGEPGEHKESEQNGEVIAPVTEVGETEMGVNTEEEERAEEEKQMTLDEWKRLEEQRKVKASFNIRQAGEGCSDPKWKKMFQLKKKLDDEDEEEEDEEEDEDEVHGKQKNIVPIAITFNDTGRRGGMNRGGRGGPRGGRGFGPRGGSRGGGFGSGGTPGKPSTTEAPNVDNEADFPSLA